MIWTQVVATIPPSPTYASIAVTVISTDTQYGIPTSASISEPAATDWATTYS